MEHQDANQKEVFLTVVKTMAREKDDWLEQVEADAQESIKRGVTKLKKVK